MAKTSCCPLANGGASVLTQMTLWYILDAFPRLGRAPQLEEMRGDLFLSGDQITCILDALDAEGALTVEPTTYMILDAYPYSGVPTRHRVYLPERDRLYCMCAVDTFYVPFLTDSDLTIRSHCFHCRAEVEIGLAQGTISRAEASESVVWNSAASYDCPMTNFFCSEKHLEDWRAVARDEKGQLYTLAEALAAGKRAATRMLEKRGKLNETLWAEASSLVCHCREVPKATIVAAIVKGASSVEQVAKATMACTGPGWCERINPKGRCCCVEIEALIDAYSVRSPLTRDVIRNRGDGVEEVY